MVGTEKRGRERLRRGHILEVYTETPGFPGRFGDMGTSGGTGLRYSRQLCQPYID